MPARRHVVDSAGARMTEGTEIWMPLLRAD
jgi:hypothetical protein